MRNLLLFTSLVLVLLAFGCQKELPLENPIAEQALSQSGDQNNNANYRGSHKVDVCHNGNIINISRNAVPAHRRHNDAIDWDGDGFFDAENVCSEGIDCDDENPYINPDAKDIPCNGIDEDCSEADDEYEEQIWVLSNDEDGDGFLAGQPFLDFVSATCPPEGYVSFNDTQFDCDDTDPSINPNAPEQCDEEVDHNCNGFRRDHTAEFEFNGNSFSAAVANFGPDDGNWDGQLIEVVPADACPPQLPII